MLKTTENQTIALAGVFQALNTVNQLAYYGSCEQKVFDDSILSTLSIDADSVASIYNNGQGIAIGLSVLQDQLDSEAGKRNHQLSRYAITIIHLENRLRSNKTIFEKLRQGIIRLESQIALGGISDSLIHNMAELYRDTISQLTPRIMVNGESSFLSNEHTASKIRASLLAAMRSAVLWRQCGGSRLKLLFKRGSYLNEINRLIEKIKEDNSDDVLPPPQTKSNHSQNNA